MLDEARTEPRLLVDESLSPKVGLALRCVGHDVVLVEEIVAFRGQSGVTDEQLIPWMSDHDAVWVHADDHAKRQHRKLLIVHQARTLWVRRSKNRGMSSREQLRVLSYVLPNLLDQFKRQPGGRHYSVSVHGETHKTRVRLKPYSI